MGLLDEARAVLQGSLPEIEQRTLGYARRTLIREGTSRQEAAYLRMWRSLALSGSDDRLLADDQLTTVSRLAIVGDAGCGKSYILQNAYLGAARAFVASSDAPLACFLDLLRHLSTRHSLEEALDYRYRGLFSRIRSEHEPGCVLFLDALDERLLSEQNPFDFVNELLFFLSDHRDQLRSVVIACRRTAWDPVWFRDSEPGWDVYHADHLGIEDYAGIIPNPTERQGFFEHADSLGIADLLSLPFIGFDLAHTYKEGRDLPTSRRDWFRQRIRRTLEGSQRERERRPAPPLETLLDLSRQLACLATFGRVSLWTVQEAIDQLGESAVLRHEHGPIAYDDLRTLFECPLFTRTDERFSFSHQLFREYLVAEALVSLPLRKQRQLLESPVPSLRHRVLTPHRGVAAFVAEVSTGFREYLIQSDPLVLSLSEVSGLPAEVDELLTRKMVDQAIATHRAPWWAIPPRGERPLDWLPKHRPRDVGRFVLPHLEASDEIALLWGTACAEVWGGSAALNDILIDLAHDASLNVEIRKNAIDAVLASGDNASIRELYDLLRSEDDQVRGHTLRAYRITESPSPSDYIAQLHGGAHNRSLLCRLQTEVASFGLSLDESQLQEAFRQAFLSFEKLGNLRGHLMRGLLGRAVELGFDDIPPPLVIRLWLSRDVGDVYYRDALGRQVMSSPSLFARLWNYTIAWIGQEQSAFFGLHDHLAELCDDQIFDLVPSDPGMLSLVQDDFISCVLRRHFLKEPTPERLDVFKERAPGYTQHLQLPRPRRVPSPRDPLESRCRIAAVLRGEAVPSHVQALRLLRTIAQVLKGDARTPVESTEVVGFLTDLSAPMRKRVLEVFAACVFELEYSRTQLAEPTRFMMTRTELAVPFWVLWELGVAIPVEKLDEFIRCYAFYPLQASIDDGIWSTMLDQLHGLDPERWGRTIVWLIEFPHANSHGPLQYLIARESDLYVERCRQRLCTCDLDGASFYSLLDYWVARRPQGFRQALRACHEGVQEEAHKAELLSVLLREDDDWAWNEVRRLIDAGSCPLAAAQGSLNRPLQLPLSASRLEVIADWYACARRKHGDDDRPNDVTRVLEAAIVQIGGEQAVEELRRLRDQDAFPGSKWLSYSILQVEDQMLSRSGPPMDSGKLLDFLNREALGVVLSERDLFEWVCQAIEDIRERLEGEARQVHGYWNRHGDEWVPKTEPECQNVLWPTIEDRLSNLAIVGVEEKLIRADRADFWVEMPVRAGNALRVAVELKVARKGYGRGRLVEPLDTQLWKRYLRPSGCRHGIYIVLWFKDNERYGYPSSWDAPDELLHELNELKHRVVAQHPVNLGCYVLDMTTAARLR